MRRLSRAVAGALATAAFIALTVSPALAGTATRTDPVGDAPTRFDITNAKYTNNSDVFGVRIKVTDLARRANELVLTFSTAAMRRDNAEFEVVGTRRADGNTTRRLWVHQGASWSRLACSDLRVSWKYDRDLVIARVPAICLGEGYGRQRAFSSLELPGGTPRDTATRTSVPYN